MARQDIGEWDKAEALVKESDKVRAIFVESWYGVRWDTASEFDLMIDTGKVSPNLAASWLVEAVKKLEPRPGSDQPGTRNIQVDPVLATVIAQVLECETEH